MILKFLGSVSVRASRGFAGSAIALMLAFATVPSQAEAAVAKIDPVSVAVVDVQLIMRQSEAAKVIREQVEARRKVYEKEFQDREGKLREEEKALAQQRAILANDVFQGKVREHQEKVAALQRDGQSMKRELDQAFSRANGEIRKQMIDIVAKIAEEADVGLVLFKNQIFLGTRKIDVTDEVMKRLNKALPKVKVTFGASSN